MKTISWADFEQVELRVGTIIGVENFPEAHKPAYIVKVDFGREAAADRHNRVLPLGELPP